MKKTAKAKYMRRGGVWDDGATESVWCACEARHVGTTLISHGLTPFWHRFSVCWALLHDPTGFFTKRPTFSGPLFWSRGYQPRGEHLRLVVT